MTILSNQDHGSFRFSNLSANLVSFKSHYESYVTNCRTSVSQNISDIFFHYLFCFFLDLDAESFEILIREHGKNFYLFFNRLGDFSQAGIRECPHVEPIVKEVTVFFTKLFQHAPDRWMDITRLIQHFVLVPYDPKVFESFWSTRAPSLTTIPVTKRLTEEGVAPNETYAFYAFFLQTLGYFIDRMEKTAFTVWIDVFNEFHKTFSNYHFLCLMEMTEEYFSKLDYVSSQSD